MKYFFISVLLWEVCNEIESNVVNYRMSCGGKISKKKVKIKAQNEKIVDRYGYMELNM